MRFGVLEGKCRGERFEICLLAKYGLFGLGTDENSGKKQGISEECIWGKGHERGESRLPG